MKLSIASATDTISGFIGDEVHTYVADVLLLLILQTETIKVE